MDAIFLGRVGYDLMSEEPHVPLKDVRRFSRYLGGSSANQAVGLARLGMRVAMIAAVSKDAVGDYLTEFLERERVDTRHIQRVEGFQTSLCLTENSPPDRFPQVFWRKDAADIQLKITPADLGFVGTARLFATNGTSLCGSPSRESTLSALEAARKAGKTVVFDVDYRAMSWQSPQHAGEFARLALPFTDIIIGNEPELCLTAGAASGEEAVKILRDKVRVVVFKLAEKGVRLISGGKEFVQAPVPIEVVSTIGAGDGFAAGFLCAHLAGKDWQDCLRYGNTAAAIVVSRLSCSEAMPSLKEVEELLPQRHREG